MMRGVIAVLTLMAGCSGWVEAQDEPSAPKFLTDPARVTPAEAGLIQAPLP